MGISFSHLPFYDLCHKRGAMQAPMFVLGSQEIHEAREVILEFAHRNGHGRLEHDGTARSLFRDRYGIVEYTDCDLNGKADLSFDFNRTLPENMKGSARTLWNAGTLEHIFDAGLALRNIHALVSTGGVIIHAAPVSWFEHGFYNFNLRIFEGVARANGYQLLVEAFHFVRDLLGGGPQDQPALFVTFDGVAIEDRKERVLAHLKGPYPSPNILYLAAFRKMTGHEFASPYDVQD
jgi:hypothetical protein